MFLLKTNLLLKILIKQLQISLIHCHCNEKVSDGSYAIQALLYITIYCYIILFFMFLIELLSGYTPFPGIP